MLKSNEVAAYLIGVGTTMLKTGCPTVGTAESAKYHDAVVQIMVQNGIKPDRANRAARICADFSLDFKRLDLGVIMRNNDGSDVTFPHRADKDGDDDEVDEGECPCGAHDNKLD